MASTTDSQGNEVKVLDTRTNSPQSTGGADSLFSAFYVFKYSGGVSKIDVATYTSNNLTSKHGVAPEVISNPTATAIIEWAASIPTKLKDDPYAIKHSPYSWSDFLFCKWYGIIPNNRLITLRKFPLPSEDNAAVKRKDLPQNIPVAQAVTWFGDQTGNDINNLWQNKWSMPWKKLATVPKDVQGNEVVNFSKALTNALPAGTNEFIKKAFDNLADQADLAYAANGQAEQVGKAQLEQKEQEYIKTLWSDNGAYWNQIQGPVNVKNQFLIRDRGLSNEAPDSKWKIVFEYKTDSYFGMSQRRIALDIIANMLQLSYSDGEWFQGLNVYYKKLGIALNPTEQAKIEECFTGGKFNATKLLGVYKDIAISRAGKILDGAIGLAGEATGATFDAIGELATGNTSTLKNLTSSDSKYPKLRQAIEIQLTKALAESFPAFLQQRAFVADVPTGNWHLTIGNPMNPIMRIGDIVVHDCQLDFGTELGPDDFPIDMKFTITVGPTRPRDSADIRRTFNLGRIDYIETFGGQTFDQANTYGVESAGLRNRDQTTTQGQGQAGGASDARVASAKTWLNARYGEGMVNEEFLKDVYFYNPTEKDASGGSN